MDEIIVRIARALANPTRLRIMSYLVRHGETTPTELVEALVIPMNALCAHVAKLHAAGLLVRRHSGRWSYCVPDSPYEDGTPSGSTMAWLSGLFRESDAQEDLSAPHEVRKCPCSADLPSVFELIYDAATAFTALRRLQILRLLQTCGSVTAERLSTELSMSNAAVSRHTSKLIRRGYVERTQVGRETAYRLASRVRSPIHKHLLDIVTATWKRR